MNDERDVVENPRRAWPFEESAGATLRPKLPRDFVARRGDGVEAVIIRIGLHDSQLVLVDGTGKWQRWVYHSVEEAEEAAESLNVPTHVGEFPEELRVRMNAYQRPAEEFDRAAYPEQGFVGPVIPYPENRPRDLQLKKTPETPPESS